MSPAGTILECRRFAGLRRRGYTPEVDPRVFATRSASRRFDSTIDMHVLENAVREHLNRVAPRVMAVLRPLKLIITNYPENQVESLTAVNNPEDPATGQRELPFCRELYIEQEDFMENPPKKFFRLAPGQEVRLRYAYIIKCEKVIKDPKNGDIREIHCSYDPETRSGMPQASRKVKGTLHWVSARHAISAEVRLYDHLFSKPNPDEIEGDQDYLANLNPHSLDIVANAQLEPSLAGAQPGDRFQFERLGYFCVDQDSPSTHLTFNRTVQLRDTWSKIAKKGN